MQNEYKTFEDLSSAFKYSEETIGNVRSRFNGIIVTENKNNNTIEYRVTEMFEQPCWGFLRKYQQDGNPDECTQPCDEKPDDLHYNFPEGTPVGLFVHYCNSGSKYKHDTNKYLRTVFSPDSPWKAGFELNKTRWKSDEKGFTILFKGTNFDPTVCINLLMHLSSNECGKGFAFFAEKYKLQDKLALFCSDFLSSTEDIYSDFHYKRADFKIQPIDYYVRSPKVDVQKYFKGEPVDHSKGSFYQKFDYNRKKVAEVYKTPEGINLCKELSTRLSSYNNEEKEKMFPETMTMILKEQGVNL